MPIHNWEPAADVFLHFHQQWTVTLCNALNKGLLPPGYSALVEVHTSGGLIPDVLALQRRPPRKPAVDVGGGALTSTPPKTRHVIAGKEGRARGNHIAIRHRLGEVVSVIEIVSPSNKASRNGLRSFVEKSIELLDCGVHLLVIDLFPLSNRDPQGIHKAIWDEIEEDTEFTLPPDKPLTLAAYRAGDPVAGIATTAYVEPVAVGDVMPDMPAFIQHFGYVNVPLETTYRATFVDCPADMRFLVETGRLPGEDD